MTKFFLKIYNFLQRRRRLCMAMMFAIIAVLLVMVSSLHYNENITDFMPMGDDEKKAMALYQDISGGQSVVIMFSMKDGDSTQTDRLTAAVDTFANIFQEGSERHQVSALTTQVDFEKYTGIADFVYQNIPLMLTDSDYVRMERIISSPEEIDKQLMNDVQTIMMPATGFFTQSISYDPLGLFAPVMERISGRQSALPIEIDNGYIFTPGHHYALATFQSPFGSMETQDNTRLISYVDSVAKQTMTVMKDVNVEATGSPVIAVDNSTQIKTDSRRAIAIAITLIILLLAFSFRSVKNISLIVFTIAFGWLFALAFMAVMRSDVSLIVLAIGSIILGIAVNYPLHFIAHTYHGGSIHDVLKDMVPPLLVGNITTVGAFAALIPLDAPALRDLGLFAVLMLVGTILFVLIFLPHLVKPRKVVGEEQLSFARASSWAPERHAWIVWATVILTLVFGYFSLFTSFDADMHHINYMTPQQERLLGGLQTSAGINDTANVYIVSEGRTWDEALASRECMSKTLDSLKSSGQISKYTDATSLICTKAEQQRRIDRWNDFWSHNRDGVINVLKRQSPEYGFSDDAFEGFYEILRGQYSPKPFEYFEPIRSTLLARSFSTAAGQYAVIDVVSAGSEGVERAEEALKESSLTSGFAFDVAGMNSSVARSLSDNFNYIGWACSLIVFFFLWISYGRLELSLLSFLPMAMGWLWILGIMYLCGMQFNVVNVILATFIFGQGDDYTIFITDGLMNEYAYRRKLMKSYKNSIIISAVILFIGMGSLIVAKHPALHSLAEVTIVGMFTVVLMAWIVPPVMFRWMTTYKGQLRHVPLTLEQLLRTIYCAVAYVFELAYGCVCGFVIRLIPHHGRRSEDWFHRLIWRTMQVNISHIKGVHSVVRNDSGEQFTRGSIMICNHESILDPIYLLALSPRVLILVSSKVWHNPLVHTLFSLAGFINLDQPFDSLRQEIGRAVARGYSVAIFPEAMRTNGRLERFHKGAFKLAQEIGADVLPVYMHGAARVMPKGSAYAAKGRIDIEIGTRVKAEDVIKLGATPQKIAHAFHESYAEKLSEMRQRIETTHYFHAYIIYKYTYRGSEIEKETRRMLKHYDDFSRWIDSWKPAAEGSNTVAVINSGHGQFALMFALVHPEAEVYTYESDPDMVALAQNVLPMPANLHVNSASSADEALQKAAGMTIFDLKEIIN